MPSTLPRLIFGGNVYALDEQAPDLLCAAPVLLGGQVPSMESGEWYEVDSSAYATSPELEPIRAALTILAGLLNAPAVGSRAYVYRDGGIFGGTVTGWKAYSRHQFDGADGPALPGFVIDATTEQVDGPQGSLSYGTGDVFTTAAAAVASLEARR